MMIVNNYDLIDKIGTSEGKINHTKIIDKQLKNCSISYLMLGGIDSFVFDEIPWLLNLVIMGSLATFNILLEEMLAIKNKSYKQLHSERQLLKLVLELRKLNVNTDLELLKESEEIKTNYKLKINKKYLPTIIENKYILVPTYDELNNAGNTSLLQEHVLGSNEYILSIGSPEKVLQLKPALNM